MVSWAYCGGPNIPNLNLGVGNGCLGRHIALGFMIRFDLRSDVFLPYI